jgi:hypothetical protein
MLALYQMPGPIIRRAHRVNTMSFAGECASSGLTQVQYAALLALRANPDADATQPRPPDHPHHHKLTERKPAANTRARTGRAA